MKNILILAMSCQAEYFKSQIDIIKETWAKDMPHDMTFGYYDGGYDNIYVEDENGVAHIKVTSPDNLDYTFLKTVESVSCIVDKYDYIMRVNTSTWVNTKLLRKFVDEIANEDTIYASELYSLTEAPCPFPLYIYPRGNAFMMSQKMWKVLINESLPLRFVKQVDDVSIGSIMNSWLLKHHKNPIDYYYGLPHGWYRCANILGNSGHALCRYAECGDADFYRDFMTVQTKKYRDRENELQNMKDFYELISKSTEPSLDLCIRYSKDPSVFVGSALGYIPLSIWKRIDKRILYTTEMKYKAIDDKENPYYSQEEYDKLHHVPGMKQ